MEPNHPTHAAQPPIYVLNSVRGTDAHIRFPSRTLQTWLKKSIAGVAAFSLSFFSCIPQVAAQSNGQPVVNSTAGYSQSTAPQSTIQAATVPALNPVDGAKARDFFRKGTEALQAHKSARAIKLFAQAGHLDPGNASYLAAYGIARQQQVSGMLQNAAEQQKAGDSANAAKKLEQALALDPNNPYVEEHLQSLSDEDESAVVRSTPMPEFSSGVIELTPAPIRATFHLRANAHDILHHVFLAYGVTAILDDSVPTQNVRLDLSHATFAEASRAVQLLTNTFVVPLDPQRVLVAKDTKENRVKFERLLLETIYLPELNAKEMADPVNMVKNIFNVRQVSVRPNDGTLSIRAPESTLRAINQTLAHLYLDKPEVMIDVRIYQVNDSHQQTLGVAFPQQFSVFNVNSELSNIISSNQSTISQLIASGLVNPGDLPAIAALLIGLGLVNGTVLNQPFALFGNGLTLSGLSFGSTTANASLTISNTREIDHVQLRAEDSQPETFLVGSRYPVITQSYSAGTQTPTAFPGLSGLLAGAAGTQLSGINPLATAPQIQYENLGLTMKTEVKIQQNNTVQMKLQVKIDALGGGTVNGIPIINNRSFTSAIQVPDGGSALLVSAVSREESNSITGIPGLSELPGFGWTASPTTQVTVGDVLIVITPHIISATHPRVATRMLFLPHA